MVDIIAVVTAISCIVKMVASIASRRGAEKAIVKRGAQIVATTRHDLCVSPG